MPGRKRLLLALRSILLFAISFAYLWSIQRLSPSMPDTDPYFHIKVADLIRERGLLQEFPWASFSLWRDAYFDKDLLFHLLLLPFTSLGLMFGAKVATAFFGALALTFFYVTLSLSGVVFPSAWTLLLLASGPGWFSRIIVLRGYLLSIAFCVTGLLAILKERPLLLFFITALYSLSYNSSFLLPLFAALYLILSFFYAARATPLKLLICSVAGLIAGIAMHPHRAAAFKNLVLQNIEVLFNAWNGDGKLRMAGELASYASRDLVYYNAGYLAAFFLSFAVLVFRGIRPALSEALLVTLTSAFFALTLVTQRFVEYWAPLQIWLLAILISRTFESGWRKRFAAIAVVASASLLIPYSDGAIRKFYKTLREPSSRQAAEWLASNAEEAEVVFTCDWDDAARLFFYNDKQRYLVMGDPLYMYGWNREVWTEWNRITANAPDDAAQKIQQDFGARFVYCTKDFGRIISRLANDPHASIAFEGQTDIIFKLHAAEPRQGWHSRSGVIIKSGWQVAGVYKPWAIMHPPPEGAEWEDLAPQAISSTGEIRLNRTSFGSKSYACAVLRNQSFSQQVLKVPWHQSYQLLISADDAVAVWALTAPERLLVRSLRGGNFADDSLTLSMPGPAFPNSLIFIVCNYTGEWGLRVEALFPESGPD
ncbi:MAG: hypothetical protein J5J00_12160 [Deltaproteobacteria bacterium]|nr:hypothetical protein [Deltaproteobacteria bacterium]